MTRIIGTFLIAAGALGLIYGGFTYTSDTHTARLGPIVLQVHDRETVYIPIAMSAAAIALGLFFVFGLRSK